MQSERDYNILLVDDEPDLLEILSVQFKSAGCNTYRAENGRDALDLFKKLLSQGKALDAVVSDYNMPQMSGLELLKSLRKMGQSTPFIFFTGYGDKEKTVEAMRFGATDFLDKPFDPDKFLKTVTKAAELGRMIKKFDEEVAQLCNEYKIPVEKAERLRRIQNELAKTQMTSEKN